jgi:hypothetical protein
MSYNYFNEKENKWTIISDEDYEMEKEFYQSLIEPPKKITDKEKTAQIAKLRAEGKEIAEGRGTDETTKQMSEDEMVQSYIEENPWSGKLAAYIAPDALKETATGKDLGKGTLKSLGKGALTAGSLLVPIPGAGVAGSALINRLGTAGTISLADYLGSEAINQETFTPDVSNEEAAVAIGTGFLGQGAGELLQKAGKLMVGKAFNVGEDIAGKLLESGDIGLFSSKESVIKSIKERINILKSKKDDIINSAVDEKFDIDAAKQEASKLIDSARDEGIISAKQHTDFKTDIISEFGTIKANIEKISPRYAYNRAKAMEQNIPKTAEGIEDIKTSSGKKGFLAGSSIRTQLNKTLPELNKIENEQAMYDEYLKSLAKAKPSAIDITKPGTFIPKAGLYQGGKIIQPLSRVSSGYTVPLTSYISNSSNNNK